MPSEKYKKILKEKFPLLFKTCGSFLRKLKTLSLPRIILQISPRDVY